MLAAHATATRELWFTGQFDAQLSIRAGDVDGDADLVSFSTWQYGNRVVR